MTTNGSNVYLVVTDRRPQDVQLAATSVTASGGGNLLGVRIGYYPAARTGVGVVVAITTATGSGNRPRVVTGQGWAAAYATASGGGRDYTATVRRRQREEEELLLLGVLDAA